MAPMIDMIFLLLIFFLVTAKWRPQEDFLPLRLSAAGAGRLPGLRPDPLEIHIQAGPAGCVVMIGRLARVRIDDGSIDTDLAVLAEKLDEGLRAQKRRADDPVEIVCDPEVRWEHLARIYNLFYGIGLTDITFRLTE